MMQNYIDALPIEVRAAWCGALFEIRALIIGADGIDPQVVGGSAVAFEQAVDRLRDRKHAGVGQPEAVDLKPRAGVSGLAS
jgi:hypothetical protein